MTSISSFSSMPSLPPLPHDPIEPSFPGPFNPGEVFQPEPRTDEDITVTEWGLCGDVLGVNVDTGDGDDNIKLIINKDGSSDLWVNGEHKGRFSKESTEKLTISTGEGNDTVIIEDNRSFQDLPLPVVDNNGANGTDFVEVRYPGWAPGFYQLEPGQRSA